MARRFSGVYTIRRNVFVAAISLFAVAGASSAEWVLCGLPFGDYLRAPVTAVAAPSDGSCWALTTYGYRWQDDAHLRWNTALYRSYNDGLLWDLSRDGDYAGGLPALHAAFQDVTLYALDFTDAAHGWAFGARRPAPYGKDDPPGEFVFLQTADAGVSWVETRLPNGRAEPLNAPDFAIASIGEDAAVAAAGNRVFEKLVGGVWTEKPGSWPTIRSLQSVGGRAWYAGADAAGRGVAGVLGGAVSMTATGPFTAMRFRDAQTGVLAEPGRLHVTSNGGGTWVAALDASGVTFRAVSSATTDFVAVGEDATGAGVAWRSRDSGRTWVRLQGALPPLYSASYRDAGRGVLGATAGAWRFVPATADANGDGATDVSDAVLLLRVVAGLVSGTGTIREAVLAARTAAGLSPGFGPVSDPSGVVVAYNSLSPDSDGDGVGDSLQVALRYAQRRGVPQSNLVAVSCPDPVGFGKLDPGADGGRGNWTVAYAAVVAPLKSRIDALGRDKANAIVFAYWTPYRFETTMPDGRTDTQALDTCLHDLWRTDERNWSSWQPYAAPSALIATRYAVPRFQGAGRPLGQPVADGAGQRQQDPVYLVSRLDGPTLSSVLAMVDNAAFAERHHGAAGYQGNAYVDTRAARFARPPYPLPELRAWLPSFYNYGDMDRSIAKCILTFADRDYPWKDEVTSASIGGVPVDEATNGPKWRDGSAAGAGPRAMFYAGWYNASQYYDSWDWLPGSVAIDFNSASAFALRGHPTIPYWAPGALGHGLTALAGVISEPYNYHPQPDVLMEYLARGYTFVEAATLATPVTRTAKALLIGDPLYRPFGGSGEAVPVPAVTLTPKRLGNAWEVLLGADVPVRSTLQYTTDGSVPAPGGPTLAGPAFFAREARFVVPAPSARYIIRATDATGRVTQTAVLTLQ